MRLPYSVLAWIIRIFLAFITFGWRSVNTEIVRIIRGLKRKPHPSEFLYYPLFTIWGFSMDLEWQGRYWQVHFKGCIGRSYEDVSFAVKLHNGAWAFNSKTVALINEKARELLLGYEDPGVIKTEIDDALKSGHFVHSLNKMFGFIDCLKGTSKSGELDKKDSDSIFSTWVVEATDVTKGVVSGFSGNLVFKFSPLMCHGFLRDVFFAELPHVVLKMDNVAPGSLVLQGAKAWAELNTKAMALVDRAGIKLKAA